MLVAGVFVNTSHAQTVASSSASTTPLHITRPLYVGTSGSDVSALQGYLGQQGYFTYPSITGFFGSFTWKAVAAFQTAHNLEAVGIVGPLTRALIAQMTEDSSTPSVISQSSQSSQSTTTPVCQAPAGLTCYPGTALIKPVSVGNGYTPGFGAGGNTVTNTDASSSGPSDTTPPIVTLSGPSGEVLADLDQTLTATTNEGATCAYATSSGTSFNSMTPFGDTGTTTHSTILRHIPYGSSPTYYVKCKDGAGNISSAVNDSFSVYPFPLQTTLGAFSYFSTEIPFKDLMFQSLTPWQTSNSGGTCAPVATDADGYPTQSLVGTNCTYYTWLVLHVPQGSSLPPGAQYPWPAGQYVLTYDGSGTVTISGLGITVESNSPGRITFNDTNPGDLTNVNITATNPADHIRNINVFLASDESTYQTQPFQQAFLNELSPYSILRFMDWAQVYEPPSNLASFNSGITNTDSQTIVLPNSASATDGAYANRVALVVQSGHWDYYVISSYDGATRTIHLASPLYWTGSVTQVSIWNNPPNQTWASRTPTDPLQQQTSSGVAYEYWIDLANTTNKNIWINIPYAANDDFVTQLATLLKNNLNPDIKIYIEYGNENWWEPGSGAWSEAQGMALGFGAGSGAQDAYSTYRSLQIFHLFDQVFGQPDLSANRDPSTDRLVRILSGQTGNVSRFLNAVQWKASNSAAPTYGLSASGYADAWAVTDYFGLPSGMVASTTPVDQMLAGQKQSIDSNTANGSGLYQLAQAAQTAGVKLIQYEGGEGLTVPDGNVNTVNTLTAMMRDPAMRPVYDQSLVDWKQFSQEFPGVIGDWAQYDDVGGPSKYGFWGMLESVMQNPTNVPRYQALLDFINNTLSIDSTAPSAPASLTAVASSTPGVIDLSWSLSTDNNGIRDYNIFRNGTNIGTTSATTFEDTGLAYSSPYTYVVKAVDTSANFSASSTSATATTSGPDTTPPTVGIFNPSSGAAVSGANVTLDATSTDNVAVATVQFKVDGASIGTPITSASTTFETTGDFTGFSDGSHTLYAVAEDTSGNYATTSILITVDNTNTPMTNLVGYWPFDASTTNWATNTTLDESGQGDSGQLVHLSTTTAPIAGAVGQALQFNMDNQPVTANNSEYVKLATSSATAINANMTIGAWVNFASSTPSGQTIIDRGTVYGAYMYNLSVDYPGKTSVPFPNLKFVIGNGSTTATYSKSFFTAGQMPLNTWIYIACTTDTSIISCYVNGMLTGTTSRATVGSSFSGTDNWFTIGTSNGPNGGWFYGGIDDARIYNRVLTAPQIMQLYDQGL